MAKPVARGNRSTPAARPDRSRFIILSVAGLVLVMIVGAVTAITLSKRGAKQSVIQAPEVVAKELNYRYRVPAGFASDAEMLTKVGSGAVFKRQEAPAAWVAMLSKDYKERMPFEAERRGEAMRALDRLFIGVARTLRYEPVTWGGQPAERAVYRGETIADNSACVGEVVVLAHQGVCYWHFAWTAEPNAEALAQELEASRNGFELLSERANWSPKQAPATVFKNPEPTPAFNLTSSDPAFAIAKRIDPKDQTPPATLALTGTIRSGGDKPYEAQVFTFVVKSNGAPTTQAETLMRTRHTPDAAVFGETKIEPLKDPLQGDPATPDTPEPATAVTRWSVKATGAGISQSSDRLVVFHAITVDGQTVIAEASCPLRERSIWERRLVQLVASLQATP